MSHPDFELKLCLLHGTMTNHLDGQCQKGDCKSQPDELYIILADYSGDLNRLKKRNGKLPADAAVERLIAWKDRELLAELEMAHKAWLTSSLVDHMNKRLAELKDRNKED